MVPHLDGKRTHWNHHFPYWMWCFHIIIISRFLYKMIFLHMLSQFWCHTHRHLFLLSSSLKSVLSLVFVWLTYSSLCMLIVLILGIFTLVYCGAWEMPQISLIIFQHKNCVQSFNLSLACQSIFSIFLFCALWTLEALNKFL